MARFVLLLSLLFSAFLFVSALPSSPNAPLARRMPAFGDVSEQHPLQADPAARQDGSDASAVEELKSEHKSVSEPTDCFCAGGSLCCHQYDHIYCNFGICGLGA
ncbi:hypothetical protein BX600DRAFT_429904 [Xylariales sp. PMI_506]|nr:hypothetical protein BX600DRAFT_429904 [Xylariales sp. PMI_506]